MGRPRESEYRPCAVAAARAAAVDRGELPAEEGVKKSLTLANLDPEKRIANRRANLRRFVEGLPKTNLTSRARR
jgi:hypothetical protein